MHSPLAAAGRTPVHDARVAALGGGLALARVALVHGAALELVTEAGTRPGHLTGRLRHGAASPADLPAVGDWVGYDAESGAVHAVLPRTSALVRAARDGYEPQVLAANVDLVVVVASLTRELSVGRIERMLTLAADAPAEALVVLSKSDLDPDPAARVAEVRAALVRRRDGAAGLDRRRHGARRRRGDARPGRDRRPARRLGRRQDVAAQPPRRRRPRDRPRSARPTTAAATRPPGASSCRSPAAAS